MKNSVNDIHEILEHGSKESKTSTIEKFWNSNNPEIINLIIERLDDQDISVRGEAFSSLFLNENQITNFLIPALKHRSKNVRSFCSLILANRKELDSINEIIKLTKDQSSEVRSCALGALGYMKAKEAIDNIYSCFNDSNIEVKQSAINAAIDIGDKKIKENLQRFVNDNDPQVRELVQDVIEKLK